MSCDYDIRPPCRHLWGYHCHRLLREGLRLFEEREGKLVSLRQTLEDSLAKGGAHDDEAVSGDIEREYQEAKAPGL